MTSLNVIIVAFLSSFFDSDDFCPRLDRLFRPDSENQSPSCSLRTSREKDGGILPPLLPPSDVGLSTGEETGLGGADWKTEKQATQRKATHPRLSIETASIPRQLAFPSPLHPDSVVAVCQRRCRPRLPLSKGDGTRGSANEQAWAEKKWAKTMNMMEPEKKVKGGLVSNEAM